MTQPQQKLDEFDRDLQPVELSGAVEDAETAPRRRRIIQVLSQFFLGQGAAQGLNVLVNLFLVHRLSVEAYAQFGLAMGFQNVFAVLMDLGFATTIVPLVADRKHDKELIGRYVRAATRWRARSFVLLAPLAAVSFFLIARRHHWNTMLTVLLLASVFLSLYSSASMAYFSAPLLIFRRLKDYYLPQASWGLVRLVLMVAASAAGLLNAWTASAISALYFTAASIFVRRKSKQYFTWPARNDPSTEREMLRYILPASPAIVFSAFQAQISLFLVSIFGGTVVIAEVAAISRIGQLIVLMMTILAVVVEPYMAGLSRERVPKYFAAFTLATIAAALPLILLGFRWPQAYIWIIGAKYAGLKPLMGWYMVAMGINFVAGTLWLMNRARKWVFWSGSILEVILVLGAEIAFLRIVGVHTARDTVNMMLGASVANLSAHIYVTILGFTRGPRLKTESPVTV